MFRSNPRCGWKRGSRSRSGQRFAPPPSAADCPARDREPLFTSTCWGSQGHREASSTAGDSCVQLSGQFRDRHWPVSDLTLIRRLSRGRNHGRMTVKPRWIARFAAFASPRCRDLPVSIDRTTDRTQDREPAIDRRPLDRPSRTDWMRPRRPPEPHSHTGWAESRQETV